MKRQNKKWRQAATIILLSLLSLSVVVGDEQGTIAQGSGRPSLTVGSRGEDVRTAQTRLQQWGYYGGTVDGVFGNGMRQAVVLFQSRNGLMADGVVGPSTWAALGFSGGGSSVPAAAGGAPASALGNRDDTLELLARVVAAEAQGEPYVGQVAVAAVILNRVRHPDFPNTVAGVVYQPHAFESVTNGLIWRRNPSDEAWRATQDALNGWDPTYGSIFFWNPYKPVSAWIWSRPVIVQHGNHVFAH